MHFPAFGLKSFDKPRPRKIWAQYLDANTDLVVGKYVWV